jgi:hypothetical protein
MAKLSADTVVQVSFWAVAELAETSQVAIKFNDQPPLLMSAEEAREFAAAVNAELEGIDRAPLAEAVLNVQGTAARLRSQAGNGRRGDGCPGQPTWRD